MGPAGRDGRDGRDGIDGQDGRDGLGVIDIVDITVEEDAWVYTGDKDNNYFFADVEMPEIDEDVFYGGMVRMYRVYNYGRSDVSQIELPYVLHREEIEEAEDGTKSQYCFTENISFEYGVGYLTFFYTISDFFYYRSPDPMRFRCVIMY